MNRVTRGTLSSWSLAAALAVAALGAGAIHRPVLVAMGVLTLLAASASCRTRFLTRPPGQRPSPAQPLCAARVRLLLPLVTLATLSLACLMQAIALPIGWLEVLSPQNAELWQRSRAVQDLPALARAPISLAPGRTLVEAAKFALYALAYAVACRNVRRQGLRRCAITVFLLGLLVATATVGLRLTGAHTLYGLYRPLNAASVSPILNNNSLVGYLNVAAFAGLGLLFSARSAAGQMLAGLGVAALVAVVLTLQSRAGTALLLSALALLCTAPGRRHQSSGWSPKKLGWLSLASITGLAAMLAYGQLRGTGLSGLTDQSLEKIDLLRASAHWAKNNWGLGIGRGAFGSAFFVHMPWGSDNDSFDHAENLWLQWAVEWGIPLSAVAFGALVYALWPLRSRASLRDPTRRGLTVGAGVLLLHNAMDLSLELPAVAGLLAYICGALQGSWPERKERLGALDRASPSSRWLAGSLCLATVSLVAASTHGSPLLTAERVLVKQHYDSATPGSPEKFWLHLRQSMAQFPAEPYFPLLASAASITLDNHPARALKWVNYALERGPWQATHYLQLGRVLLAHGLTEQALGAVRRSVELSPGQIPQVQRLSQLWQLTPEQAYATVPNGPAGGALLRRLARDLDDRTVRLRWLREALQREGSTAEGHFALAAELLFHLEHFDPIGPCAPSVQACRTAIEDHLDRVPGEKETELKVSLLRAQLEAILGNDEAAQQLLTNTCQRYPQNTDCHRRLVELALRRDDEQVEHHLAQWVAVGCSTAPRCAATHQAAARSLLGAGRKSAALTHLRKAAEQMPSAATWTRVAQLAVQLQQHALAERATRRAQRLDASARSHNTQSPTP